MNIKTILCFFLPKSAETFSMITWLIINVYMCGKKTGKKTDKKFFGLLSEMEEKIVVDNKLFQK